MKLFFTSYFTKPNVLNGHLKSTEKGKIHWQTYLASAELAPMIQYGWHRILHVSTYVILIVYYVHTCVMCSLLLCKLFNKIHIRMHVADFAFTMIWQKFKDLKHLCVNNSHVSMYVVIFIPHEVYKIYNTKAGCDAIGPEGLCI